MNTMEQIFACMGRMPDEDQKKAIMSDGNLVVAAGAGSGKTTVLAYRYLRLLLDGIHADEILALTFTEKATKEMQGRIGTMIKGFSTDPRLDAQSRELFAKEWTEHFPKASISTLDSFSSRILKSNPFVYGLTEDYAIDANGEQNTRNATLLARQMLSAVDKDEGARLLATLYKPSDAVEVLVYLALQVFHLPHRMPSDAGDIVQRQIEEKLAQVKTRTLDILSGISRARSLSVLAPSSEEIVSVAEKQLSLLCDGSDEAWEAFLASPESVWSKSHGRKDGDKEINNLIDQYRECREKLCGGFHALAHKEALPPLVDFLHRFEDAFQKTKLQTGVLTFHDVSSLAIDTLANDPQLRAWYVHQFKAIMIDEFQDDNKEQKDLLYLLSAKDSFTDKGVPDVQDILPDRLFFVGDEKQSIYRFRGADVSVFKNLSAELSGGQSIELFTNYRTEPYLIEDFNSMFGAIMQGASEPFEASFKPLKHKDEPTEGVHSSLTVMIKPKRKAEDGMSSEEMASDADCEAFAIAKKMHEMLTDDNWMIADGGVLRRPQPKDIALLLRSGTHQMSFERAFKALDIPYTMSQVSRSLMLEAPTSDIYCLLETIAYPEDSLAFLSALRSPFFNLGDDKIFPIVKEAKRAFDDTVFQDIPEYVQACELYKNLWDYSLKASLPSLLQYVWYDLGYRCFYLQRPKYHAYLDHYDYLYRLAEVQQESGASLVSFLDVVRSHLGSGDKMDEGADKVLTEAKDGVQIMSIHASKGLEFPIVFVANLSGDRSHAGRKYFMVDDFPVLFYDVMEDGKSCGAAKLLASRDEDAPQVEAEAKRLLYVAATRAKYHLVFSGFQGSSSAKLGNMLDWIIGSLGINGDEERMSSSVSAVKVEVIPAVTERDLWADRRLSETGKERVEAFYAASEPRMAMEKRKIGARVFAPEKPHSFKALELPRLKSDAVLEAVVGKDAGAITDFGTFVHTLVEQRMVDGSSDPMEALPKGLKDIGASELKVLVNDAVSLANGFLASPYYQEQVVQFPHETEVRFYSHEQLEGKRVVVEGVVDLLIHKPEATVVLDFKTDQLCEPSVHQGQLSLYRHAMERIYGTMVQAGIVYLRDPRVIHWLTEEK